MYFSHISLIVFETTGRFRFSVQKRPMIWMEVSRDVYCFVIPLELPYENNLIDNIRFHFLIILSQKLRWSFSFLYIFFLFFFWQRGLLLKLKLILIYTLKHRKDCKWFRRWVLIRYKQVPTEKFFDQKYLLWMWVNF